MPSGSCAIRSRKALRVNHGGYPYYQHLFVLPPSYQQKMTQEYASVLCFPPADGMNRVGATARKAN